MGEAKRRKRLDPSWGKKKTESLEAIDEHFLEEFRKKYLSRQTENQKRYELLQSELKDIISNQKYSCDQFQYARMLLFEHILKYQGEEEDSQSYIPLDTIKEAGKILNEIGGIESMRSPLIFDCIPKSWHRIIDVAFDGIGEWRC